MLPGKESEEEEITVFPLALAVNMIVYEHQGRESPKGDIYIGKDVVLIQIYTNLALELELAQFFSKPKHIAIRKD
ncbi:hypothetical protein STEG23_010721 [Scotinomys teguina]